MSIVTKIESILNQLSEVDGMVEKAKAHVEEIKYNFAYNVQEAAVISKERIQAIELEVDKLHLMKSEKEVEILTDLDELKQKIAREKEQVTHDHKLAVRDMSLTVASKIAGDTQHSLIPVQEYVELKKFKTNSEKDFEAEKKALEVSITSRMNAAHKTDLDKIVSDCTLQNTILTKENESMKRETASLIAEKSKLHAIIEEQNRKIVEIASAATRPTTVYETKK